MPDLTSGNASFCYFHVEINIFTVVSYYFKSIVTFCHCDCASCIFFNNQIGSTLDNGCYVIIAVDEHQLCFSCGNCECIIYADFLLFLASLMPKLTIVGVLLTPPFSRWNLSDASLGRCFRKQITSYYRCPKKHPKIYYISTFNVSHIILYVFYIFKQLIHIKYPLQKTNQLLFF